MQKHQFLHNVENFMLHSQLQSSLWKALQAKPNVLGNKIACSQLLLPSHSFSLTPEQLIEKHNTSGLKRGLDQGLYSKYFSARRWGTATHLSNWHLQPSKQRGIDWALRSVSVEREQVLSYILALITSYSLSGIRKSK